ncbi:MAG TPA: hypothetical protein VHV75_10020 [Solirubrobacteraceae bacterium]|nr:hypothetical protein [Solirubrobacteraceae bacterium]
MRIAFATCSAYPDGRADDGEVAALVGAEFQVWDDAGVDWSAYDRVVIRSVWDYSHRVETFLEWCEKVGETRLRNRPEVVTFNSDKRYLPELGVPTVPTAFVEPGESLGPYSGEIVVKPNISAGARDTGRFEQDAQGDAAALVARIHDSGRIALIQPYLRGVDTQGETAVVFFGGDVSHVLRKRPVLRTAGIAPRAEVAHAPAAAMLEPDLVSTGQASATELELATAAHAEITRRFGTPLYARVDIVPGADGAPVLIELELIEPNMYMNLVPAAIDRLAAAIRVDAQLT